jgi:hypothetical protein
VSSGNQIFLVGRTGTVYVWEHESSSKFKPYKNIEGEAFSEIYVGKGMQFLLKGFVESTLCKVYEQEKDPESCTHPTIFMTNSQEVLLQSQAHVQGWSFLPKTLPPS